MDRCKHERAHQMRRVTASGAQTLGLFCPDCGSWRIQRCTNKAALQQLPEYSEEVAERIRRAHWAESSAEYQEEAARQEAARQAAREEANQEWWRRYNDYLGSPRWKRKRQQVMERACRTCEARVVCNGAPAVQVHHTSYKHVGNEPLFDLRAVCVECHEHITEWSRYDQAPLDTMSRPKEAQ